MSEPVEEAVPVEEESLFSRRVLKRKPKTAVYELPEDPNDSDTLAPLMLAAFTAENRAQTDPTGDNKKVARKLRADYDKARAAIPMMEFHLRAIGNKAYDALLSKWPATDEQIEAAKAQLGSNYFHLPFDSDEFPPRLLKMAISKIVLPEGGQIDSVSLADIQAMMSDGGYSAGDLSGLLNMAMELNQKSSKVESLLKG